MIFIPLLLFGLLALWIWSLVKMPSKRAREIFDASGPAPSGVSDRDRAYVVDLYSQYGTGEFMLRSIRHRSLDPVVAERFGVAPSLLDDRTELGVRLPSLKLLVSFEPGRYRLTEEARRLAERAGTSHKRLENTHHG